MTHLDLGKVVPTSLFVAIMLATLATSAEPPRVLPEGQQPNDRRLQALKDLNGYFPFEVPETKAAWSERAERVRRQLLVSNGLWPLPTKTPLNANIHGLVERDTYTIERVYFESFPGFYVTGSLYRPKDKSKNRPGILCPHGHWKNGRFYDAGEAQAKQQFIKGGERFMESGRSPLQARCVQLARMGCVVFHYDMIGYADSQQITYELAHRFAKQRPGMNAETNWGLFSPQAESRLQSVMGLQTWNSIRATDFMESLPDVDKSRLAVTGASGGGTQAMILAAVEPRIALSIPAVMVSTSMQGGCTCENCSLMRVETGNVEFAALFAPKPQMVTAANDWTKEMAAKGFPQLQQLYSMMDAKDQVKLHSRVEYNHNYNYVSRAAMYSWVNRHFNLGHPEPIIEEEIVRSTTEEMTVWNDEHPQPEGGDDFERSLLKHWDDDAHKQLAGLRPTDQASFKKYVDVVGGGIDTVVGRSLPGAKELEFEERAAADGEVTQVIGLLRHRREQEELPLVLLQPQKPSGTIVIYLQEEGKSGLYDEDDQFSPDVQKLLAGGATVVGVDLFGQGEFLKKGESAEETRRVKNPREAAAYTFGFNHSMFARRVHDILTVVAFARSHDSKPKNVHLIGLDGTGPLVAAARTQARDAINRAVINTRGFRFAKVNKIHSPQFLPGGAKYDDLIGMLVVAAPSETWLGGEDNTSHKKVTSAYKSVGASKNLQIMNDDVNTSDAIDWLLAD